MSQAPFQGNFSLAGLLVPVEDEGDGEGHHEGDGGADAGEVEVGHGGVQTDITGQGQQAGRAAGVVLGVHQSHEEAAHAAAGHGGDHVGLDLHGDAEEHRLGDTAHGGDAGGGAQLLTLGVLGLEGDCQGGGALGHVGGQLAGVDDGVEAQGHAVVDADGGEGVVGASHDQEGQEQADDGGHQPGGDVAQGVHHEGDAVGDDIADGAKDAQGGDAGDEHGDEGHGEELDGLGGDLVRQGLHLGHEEHAQDDGDNRGGVACVIDGQAEDGQGLAGLLGGGDEGDKVGVDQDAAQHHSQVGVAPQLLGGGVGQQDGQEVEVTDDMCLDCGQASCTGFCSFVPKKKIVNSLDVAVMLNNNQLAFKSEAECKRYCQRRNKELLKNKITAKKVSSDMSTYKPRADLSEEHVEKLRRADRDYYEDHKEEVNQKDRDKYHRLHPNARYYKPRKPKEEKAKNGQLPGQLSFEDIGVNIPTENS